MRARFQRRTVDLGKAINSLAQQFWTRMGLLVPTLVFSDVLQAEVGSQVDDAHSGRGQCAGLVHRHTVRVAKNTHPGSERRSIGFDEGEIDGAAQRGEHSIHPRSCFTARGNRHQFGSRMLGKQAQQLDAV